MASTNISRLLSSGSATNKFTLSFWAKRSVDTAGRLFTATGSSGDTYFRFNGDATMEWSGDGSNASSAGYFITNRKFDDYSGWYHLVIRFDSTQAGASNRIRFYVNGILQESFSSFTDINQNAVDKINLSGNTHYIGGTVSSQYFHGLMSHVHYCDGYSYGPTEFGETDATTGEWKIKTSPAVTYGTNGYFVLKDGNSLTDQSTNSNNFSLANGTLTNTEDCPSNVFANLNPLDLGDLTNIATLSNGNTYYSSTQGGYNMMVTTLGASSGKWYWEAKYISHNMHGNSDNFGINPGFTGDRIPIGTTTSYLGKTANAYVFADAGNVINNDTTTTYASGATTANNLNDIVGIALDLDNNKAYYHVNGTYWNSANPSNGTGGLSINPASQTETGFYFPSISDKSSIRSYVYAFNFGNGYFGTTAVSSAGTNASGNGIFEYDVPTGFTALSTKGLNL